MSHRRRLALALVVAAGIVASLLLLAPEADGPRVDDVSPAGVSAARLVAEGAPVLSAIAFEPASGTSEVAAPGSSLPVAEGSTPARRWRGTLAVTVSRGRPAVPAAGAKVVVEGAVTTEASTDAQGRASIEVEAYARLAVSAQAEGEASATAAVKVAHGASAELSLRLLPTPCELVTRVVDAAGAPIPTAWVEVEGAGPVRRVAADAGGQAVVAGLPEVELRLRCGAPGFRTSLSGGVPSLAPAPERTIDLERVVRLEGRLLVGGRPLPAGGEPAELLVDSNQLRADADGRFTAEVVGGPRAIEVSACATCDGKTLYGAGRVTPDAETVRLDVELVGPGVVRGRVLRGGRPCDDLQVLLRSSPFPFGFAHASRVGLDGQFCIQGAPPGKATLQAGAAWFLPVAEVEVEVRPGETTFAELGLESTADLSGVLTRDGVAVVGERVSFTRDGRHGGSRETDGGGRFLARGLAPGRWTLATRSERGHGTVEVGLEAGQAVTDVALALGPPARLVVRVVDAAGAPVTATRVSLCDPAATYEGIWLGTTDPDGVSRLDWTPGPLLVRLFGSELERLAHRRGVRAVRCEGDATTVVLKAGETTEVVFRIVDQR